VKKNCITCDGTGTIYHLDDSQTKCLICNGAGFHEKPAPRKPTIYEALTAKLGRAPTNTECRDECRRIIASSAEYAPRAPSRYRVERRTFDTLSEAQAYAKRFLPRVVAICYASPKL